MQRREPPGLLHTAAGFGGALLLWACGASVQTIYEGNVRFEHCYRLDLDPTKAASHRHACWRNWLQIYTYGQPRDRIEYARRRVHSIAAGDVDRPVLKLAQDHDPTERQWYVSTPAPMNAHAPPPATAEQRTGASTTTSGTASPPGAGGSWTDSQSGSGTSPPEAQCASACRDTWQSCLEPCGADAGPRGEPCAKCEPDYLACMRRCFR
jgi:hypothetical protein